MLATIAQGQDITERRQAEEKNLRLNRMYRTISQCNQALVRATDELELCRAMCQVLVEHGGYRLARVSYAGGDPEKSLVRVAWAGAGEDFCPADACLTWADTGGCQVPVARTLRSGTPQICHDIATDPGFAPWRDAALACGYASNIGLPLFDGDGRILGGLSIYSAEPHVFNEDETLLLSELAGDLAFGIVNIRARAERMGILEKLELSLDHAVTAIAATVEMRDPYTAGHQRRVAKLAAAIAKEMGLPEQQVEGLRMAGVVHDIGKIHVPAEILSNPSKLTAAEFEIIKTHPQAGYDILKGIDFPWPVAEIVYQHHEKLDGSGYPRGLKGEEILLEARILTVADVVEAMASHRPYRPGFGVFPSLQEIARNKGKFYDKKVVTACLRLFMEKNYEL
ncbi:MAG: HD domain-containing protein [Gallionella sp.]|nr:HD domain-containing protein [Gallionella sp.]